MNTTITKDQMILHDGEVHIFRLTSPMQYRAKHGGIKIFHNEHFGWQLRVNFTAYKITHSTAKLDGVIRLQREWFVKGEQIDANEEFAKLKGYSEEKFDNEEWSELYWFGAGITTALNAKKGEFTREEMELAFNKGLTSVLRSDTRDYTFNKFMNSLQTLSVPEQITLTKEGDLKNIQW